MWSAIALEKACRSNQFLPQLQLLTTISQLLSTKSAAVPGISIQPLQCSSEPSSAHLESILFGRCQRPSFHSFLYEIERPQVAKRWWWVRANQLTVRLHYYGVCSFGIRTLQECCNPAASFYNEWSVKLPADLQSSFCQDDTCTSLTLLGGVFQSLRYLKQSLCYFCRK